MGHVPSTWKEAAIVPIYKGGDRSLAKNYRPISLTSTIMKVLERIIRKQLVDFLGMCMTSRFTVRTIVTFSGPVFKQKYKVNFFKLFVRSIVVFRTKFHQYKLFITMPLIYKTYQTFAK